MVWVLAHVPKYCLRVCSCFSNIVCVIALVPQNGLSTRSCPTILFVFCSCFPNIVCVIALVPQNGLSTRSCPTILFACLLMFPQYCLCNCSCSSKWFEYSLMSHNIVCVFCSCFPNIVCVIALVPQNGLSTRSCPTILFACFAHVSPILSV